MRRRIGGFPQLEKRLGKRSGPVVVRESPGGDMQARQSAGEGGDRALCELDAQGLAAAFAAGRAQPPQALQAMLRRIERFDGRLGACNHLADAGLALQAAAASAARWRAGAPLSPLDGVAFGVKANIAVRGLPWHGGIGAFRSRRAAADAACVARLRAAGMIPLAICNMHEAALGETSDNPWFGATRNPHDPTRIPGGSSGGSAAAVAAGLVPIALGTDDLGSVRLPSALCGVLGFKPAYGEIPVDGLMPLSPRFDHLGVHARSLDDLVQIMRLLAPPTAALEHSSSASAIGWMPKQHPGPGENAEQSRPPESSGGALPLVHWRIGPRLPFAEPIAQAFADLLQAQAVREVADWSDLDLSALRRAALLICERDAARHFAAPLKQNPQGFSPAFRQLIAWGAQQPAEKAQRAQAQLARASRRLRADLGRGLLLSPATPHPAPRRDGEIPATLADLTAPAAIAGAPAISIPMGFSPQGLPLGLQIAGRESAEVLRAAQAFFPGAVPIVDPADGNGC